MNILKYFGLGYMRMQQILFYQFTLMQSKEGHYTLKMYNKSRLIVTVKRFRSKNGPDFINATTLNIY